METEIYHEIDPEVNSLTLWTKKKKKKNKIKGEGSTMWGWRPCEYRRKIWASVLNGSEAQMEITTLKKFVAHQRNMFASFASLFRSFM